MRRLFSYPSSVAIHGAPGSASRLARLADVRGCSARAAEVDAMRKTVSAVMLVIGVGLMMFGFSNYVPGGSEVAGWSESCRYVMTPGAMLATTGRLLS